jgi:hypothetical protein
MPFRCSTDHVPRHAELVNEKLGSCTGSKFRQALTIDGHRVLPGAGASSLVVLGNPQPPFPLVQTGLGGKVNCSFLNQQEALVVLALCL